MMTNVTQHVTENFSSIAVMGLGAEPEFAQMALSARLREVEAEFEAEGDATGRERLAAACVKYAGSRYELGRELADYRDQFRSEGGGWMAAVSAIAGWMKVSPRTVLNILADYEDASGKYSEAAIAAALAAGLDPAPRRNASVMDEVEELVGAAEIKVEEAAEVVGRATKTVRQKKIAKRAAVYNAKQTATTEPDRMQRLSEDAAPDVAEAGLILDEAQAAIQILPRVKPQNVVPPEVLEPEDRLSAVLDVAILQFDPLDYEQRAWAVAELHRALKAHYPTDRMRSGMAKMDMMGLFPTVPTVV